MDFVVLYIVVLCTHHCVVNGWNQAAVLLSNDEERTSCVAGLLQAVLLLINENFEKVKTKSVIKLCTV